MFDRKELFERDVKIIEFAVEELERINEEYERFLDEFYFLELCEYLESKGMELYEELESGKKVYRCSNKFLVVVNPLGKSKLIVFEKVLDGKFTFDTKELPASLEKTKKMIEFYVQS